jgi:hypothetical protein
MSKIKTFLALSSVAFAGLAMVQPAQAQPYGDGYHDHGHRHGSIRARQERQERRIEEGVASGELTRREAYRLEREQAYIRQAKREARSDGYISPGERARLEAMQDRAGRHIRHERHDEQVRRW